MTDLAGRAIAISISDAPDRLKLGFPEREIERALYSICMAVVRAGARVVYAGDLRPSGYTFKIFRHLAGAYAAQGETPFTHVVPQPVLSRSKFDDWVVSMKEARNTAKTLLVIGGELVPFRLAADGLLIGGGAGSVPSLMTDAAAFGTWLSSLSQQEDSVGFTAARQAVTGYVDARIAMGGKMGLLDNPTDRYRGAMPGVIEEIIMSLETRKPCALLGAFGGATRDGAIALGLLPLSDKVPRGLQMPSYDIATSRLALLHDAIPASLRDRMAALADDDRLEYVATAVVDLLTEWLRKLPVVSDTKCT
ncbi:hypothetical protein [Mesorhizobium sp.]|uniref:hypothetical protein n=1 Tax=Mesorhizobium sp. TaxID=1871066 RepID=UPI000FE55D76|nr:hypothetical protein [Mesorhizobium sp.]RWE79577.1 MAG: hypothetical protein EOS42_00975 [Mesorhizobium sp.]